MSNKKAQYALAGMMIAVVVIIMALQLITPLRDMITVTRAPGSTGLDCGNSSISTGSKITCIAVDLSLPVFAFVCIGAAFGYLIGKKIEYQYQPPQQ